MCTGGKCLFFINLRTGSLIFAYINAIISGIGTIFCTGYALYVHISLMFNAPYSANNQSISNTLLLLSGYLLEFVSAFICSVLLLIGITQNKASLIKTYIIYGMVQVVLLFTYFIILHCVADFFTSGYVILTVAILGIYASCLYMLFLIYQPMSQNNLQLLNPLVNSGA